MIPAAAHVPVLLDEVLAALAPRSGGVYVDGTFGAGGYSEALLRSADCRVFAIDRDPDALALGRDLAARFPGRIRLIEGRFGDMERSLAALDVMAVDGVALDLGVSSMQLDRAERGFSLRADGPLDMRMGKSGVSAADLVNTLPEDELARILHELGEERFSRRIAGAIVRGRPFARTHALADVIRRAIPVKGDGIDPATRSFQAIRMAVNDELMELQRALGAAERLLAPDGVLAVVTFHSLEDRPVKTFLQRRAGKIAAGSRHLPQIAPGPAPSFALLAAKPVTPGEVELRANPRARSAKLRAARRTAAAPWPADFGPAIPGETG